MSDCVRLTIRSRHQQALGANVAAAVHPSTLSGSGATLNPSAVCYLQLASGSDCILYTRCCCGAALPRAESHLPLAAELILGSCCGRLDEEVAPGQLLLDAAQQYNMRLLPKETYSFRVYPQCPPDVLPLVEVEAEVLLLEASAVPEQQRPCKPPHAAAPPAAAAANAASASAAPATAVAAAASPPELGASEHMEGEDMSEDASDLSSSSDREDSLPSQQQDPQQPRVVQVDAQQLAAAFSRSCFGRILAINEHVVLRHGGALLLLRITSTHTATADEREELIGYHCFRGRLTPDTRVYLATADTQQSGSSSSRHDITARIAGMSLQPGNGTTAHAASHIQNAASISSGPSSSSQHAKPVEAVCLPAGLPPAAHQQYPSATTTGAAAAAATAGAAAGSSSAAAPSRIARLQGGQCLPVLQLVNMQHRADRPPPTNLVHITTDDGEWFPVKRALLRPCLKLTSVVRDAGDTAPSVTVNVDTLTFDRVLIFMEALALDRQPPDFSMQHLPALAQAAEELGLTSLVKYCSAKAGNRAAALARYTPAQVAQAIAAGGIWLMLDGMVLDVGAWLPQHPGGTAIIPRQAMNVDCSRFFEMYHASRESFLYLKEFYIGELWPPEAAAAVPPGGGQLPSAEFMAQLREFTGWRRVAAELPESNLGVAFKSF